ncbi:hypothetical protein J1N35_014143 [Gossypium stocksii]|uniref:Uncharacterized protein n=1 Tax=Gossypium stocksii TaxID=47602 RepID=A0A9D4A9M9_9ROSI|nr:hypothetical protein J1N35_014143 [Gossypium stocksii]
MDVEVMLDRHCFSGNVILELYAHFIDVEECGLSLTIVSVNLFLEQEVESQTTRFMRWFHSIVTKLLSRNVDIITRKAFLGFNTQFQLWCTVKDEEQEIKE